MKNLFLLLLLIICEKLPAQVDALRREVARFDSLVDNHHLREAENLGGQLLQSLKAKPREKQYVDLQVSIMIRLAEVIASNNSDTLVVEMVLEAIELAQAFDLPEREYDARLSAAVVFEGLSHLDLCRQQLDQAHALYRKYKLENRFSTYCVRNSSYHYRNDWSQGKHCYDTAVYYAQLALEYGEKYERIKDVADAHLLMGLIFAYTDYELSVSHYQKAARLFLLQKRMDTYYLMLFNIANSYASNNKEQEALIYIDSVYAGREQHRFDVEYYYRLKHEVYSALAKYDSAYWYFKLFHQEKIRINNDQLAIELRNVTERYDNDKKELVIKSKNNQVIVTVALLVTITALLILLANKNRKINTQNKVISGQLVELTKILEQKQVLLSELQHRVKNNLQHVISILEIQKESADFNNIEELIRGNQNRIHSMALLHKKLNVADSVNEVDLQRYITELAELVKESYDSPRKKIALHITCEIATMSIEKALPLGLIVVELVSNSMKHAFKKQSTGIIHISLTKEPAHEGKQLLYSDSGAGFDFDNPRGKGLGIEILKGLIDQLDASVETNRNNGFNLILHFK